MSTRHCLRWHYMCRPILKIYQLCALLSLLVICCLIEILLAVPEWEREWMGIINGNGNKTRLNLGLGMGMELTIGNGREWDWKRYARSSLQWSASRSVVAARMQCHLNGSRPRGACAPHHIQLNDGGRLGPAAELSSRSRLHGRIAGHRHNSWTDSPELPLLDHHWSASQVSNKPTTGKRTALIERTKLTLHGQKNFADRCEHATIKGRLFLLEVIDTGPTNW